MRATIVVFLLTAVCFAGEVQPPKSVEREQQIPVSAQPGQAQIFYKAQLLGELDLPVGASIALPGQSVVTTIDAIKGTLTVEIGKSKQVLTSAKAVNVSLKREEGKGTFSIMLYFVPKRDKTWTYRNMTQLNLIFGKDKIVVIDADGNGEYNQPGKDGMTWAGQEYLFPLPDWKEKWCTGNLELGGFSLGRWGEDVKLFGKPLATTVPAALDVLKGINQERVALGFCPRPEDKKLSEDLQKHCAYMKLNGKLQHPEEFGTPGYSKEGNDAGQRSILCEGWGPSKIASGMVDTLFHRYDVIRPNTSFFGVGYEGKFGGIDGRTSLFVAPAKYWPMMCPAPGQSKVRDKFRQENPQPIPDPAKAGFPITMYFGTEKLKLVKYSLKMLKGPKSGQELECHTFDPQTAANNGLIKGQMCCALIPKEPLAGTMPYEVSMTVEVNGKSQTWTWQFTTE